MKFTSHAEFKLSLYGLSQKEVEKAMTHVITECKDTLEKSRVIIFQMIDMTWAGVMSEYEEKVITIYPTDTKTISNRRRSGRWNCR